MMQIIYSYTHKNAYATQYFFYARVEKSVRHPLYLLNVPISLLMASYVASFAIVNFNKGDYN